MEQLPSSKGLDFCCLANRQLFFTRPKVENYFNNCCSLEFSVFEFGVIGCGLGVVGFGVAGCELVLFGFGVNGCGLGVVGFGVAGCELVLFGFGVIGCGLAIEQLLVLYL